MQVRIKETGETKELTIKDRNGCDYAADLMADDDNLTHNSDGDASISQESFDWWQDVLTGLASAEERKAEVWASLNNVNQSTEFEKDLNDACACDLEDMPAAINEVCEKWEELLNGN